MLKLNIGQKKVETSDSLLLFKETTVNEIIFLRKFENVFNNFIY